ncbi:type III secretion system cytoplasmic ring protein SctQ [Proteus mirabilis]|uniref:type III secretion system cytoplasmic ring protein SctQ n=1 Tax=Proteus mirabilis TaxID=584 RepID=UPI00234A526B|nr:type III secretion system cytoplasmic ring protein SctQ [Proteus mirabilis]MDC5886294.1 type III secretion system cytoplasmic ring protein SctQ [Proteus mirabilis]MDC5903891.1 type III secretion system cytoplasmic ring protein SctQ [Proteus mirabilis]MDC5907441.1 type III secretion system cytoplasmic ring protein SctQ [Proteus mirabilis]MDC5921548.1 type III secretion system cytoplasmic ring protein SctQ [Proteus mirabilis]MDC5932073.1 type III secretion system cytoplasmic ring protein SctQ
MRQQLKLRKLEDKRFWSTQTMIALSSQLPCKETNQNERYFQVLLTQGNVQIEAFLACEEALTVIWPQSAHFPWAIIPQNYLMDVLIQYDLPVTIDGFEGEFSVTPQGIVQKIARTALWVSSSLGALFITDASGLSLASPERCAAVPIIVDFVLGITRLSISLLNSIAVGDILLIERMVNLLTVGDTVLLKFAEYSRENVMMENISVSDELFVEESCVEEMSSTKPAFDVKKLNVDVRFILHKRMMSIEELSALQAGSLVSLPENTELNVILEVNGYVFARGELVQVGNRLGVEIQPEPNKSIVEVEHD